MSVYVLVRIKCNSVSTNNYPLEYYLHDRSVGLHQPRAMLDVVFKTRLRTPLEGAIGTPQPGKLAAANHAVTGKQLFRCVLNMHFTPWSYALRV